MADEPALEYARIEPRPASGAWVAWSAALSCFMFAAGFVFPFGMALCLQFARPGFWRVNEAQLMGFMFFGSSPVGLVLAVIARRAGRGFDRPFTKRLAVIGLGLNAGMCVILLLIAAMVATDRL